MTILLVSQNSIAWCFLFSADKTEELQLKLDYSDKCSFIAFIEFLVVAFCSCNFKRTINVDKFTLKLNQIVLCAMDWRRFVLTWLNCMDAWQWLWTTKSGTSEPVDSCERTDAWIERLGTVLRNPDNNKKNTFFVGVFFYFVFFFSIDLI